MPKPGDKIYTVLSNGKLNELEVVEEVLNLFGKPVYWLVRKDANSSEFSVHYKSEYRVTKAEAIADHKAWLDAKKKAFLAKMRREYANLVKLAAEPD